MSNPAYLWLSDENGSPIAGGSMVTGRIGAIELKNLTHNLNIPVDSYGRLTGTRIHAPIVFQKEFDKTTPLLYRAISLNSTLKSAVIKMYMTNEAGAEVEYFNILLDEVKITSITPDLYPGLDSGTHLETVQMRYKKITWKHCDGNIMYTDQWNQYAVM